jgi:dUTP pyrophosphatase
MKVKFKEVVVGAKEPRKAYKDDSGHDLYAISDGVVKNSYIEYETGIAIEPSEGYHTNVYPRSSISDTDLVLANSVGLVDNGYRNTIKVRFKVIPRLTHDKDGNWVVANKNPIIYHKGDKIAQLVFHPTVPVELVKVDELADSERSTNGFGSTGK